MASPPPLLERLPPRPTPRQADLGRDMLRHLRPLAPGPSNLENPGAPEAPTPSDASHAMLRHNLRAAILAYAQANPGTLQSRMAQELGCARATIRHHVTMLERAGLIQVQSGAQRAAIFCASLDDTEQAARAALARGRALELARFVAAHPGASQKDIGDALGFTRKLLRKHVDRLSRAGLVEERRGPPHLAYHATDRLTALLGPERTARQDTSQGGDPPGPAHLPGLDVRSTLAPAILAFGTREPTDG